MALTQVNSAGIADGAIVNADVNNSAAVALSKLSTSGTASSSTFLRGDGAWTAIDLANLSASNLTSGTVPDARFPATLPALSGTALTNLNASNISSGTLAAARLPASYAVLSGSTDNQIATVTGANALQGEASLTFDAGLLKIDDLSGTAGKGRLEFGNSGEQYIEGFDTGNGGSGSYLSFGDGSAEYLRLDSSGRLRIGNTTQNQYTAADDLIVGSGSGDRGLTLYSGSSDSGVIAFSDGTIDTQYRSGQIIYDHSADSMVFRTNGNYTRLKITSDGKIGINETSPDFALHVKTTTDVEQLKVENSASSGRAQIRYVNPHGDWSTGTIGGTTEGDFITYTAEARNYRLYTSNNERLRINSSGLLLLGTTDSGFSTGYTNMTIGNTSTQNTGLTIASSASNGYSRLHFSDGTSGAARYAGWIVYDHAVDAIKFSTANSGSSKVSIDLKGRLLVNTPTAMDTGSGDLRDTIQATHTAGAQLLLARNDQVTNATNRLGEIAVLGNDSDGTFKVCGSIRFEAELAHDTNDKPTAILFKTCADNSTSLTERMRITHDGNVGIGTTSPGGFKLKVEGGDSDEGLFVHTGASSSQWLIRAEDNAANQRFVVKASGEVTTPNQPCAMYASLSNAATNFATNSTETLIFHNSKRDEGSDYNNSNGRFTAPVAGTYLVGHNCLIDNNASDASRSADLQKNGSGYITLWYDESGGDNDYHGASGTAIIELAANDYISIRATAGIHTGSETNFFAYLLG